MSNILDDQPSYDCPSCGRIYYDLQSIHERLCIGCGGMGTWGMRHGLQTADEHAAEIDRHRCAKEGKA